MSELRWLEARSGGGAVGTACHEIFRKWLDHLVGNGVALHQRNEGLWGCFGVLHDVQRLLAMLVRSQL